MKDTINYYYNILIKNIHQINNDYYFNYKNSNYLFCIYNRLPEELIAIYEISQELNTNKVPFHKIILNKDNQILTYYKNRSYILLKILVSKNKIITPDDILIAPKVPYIRQNINVLRRDKWSQLWKEKIDYVEYQLKHLNSKYPLIFESVNYFIGLGEIAISYIENVPASDEKLAITNKRIRYDSTIYDILNPLNIIIDYQIRNICEYCKSFFLNNVSQSLSNAKTIFQMLKNANFSNYDCKIFFGRLLFPSYYFDLYEAIITGEAIEKDMHKIIDNVNIYETQIKDLYQIMLDYYDMPYIEWLSQKKT